MPLLGVARYGTEATLYLSLHTHTHTHMHTNTSTQYHTFYLAINSSPDKAQAVFADIFNEFDGIPQVSA